MTSEPSARFLPIALSEFGTPGGPAPAEPAARYCEQLESGAVLYFPQTPIAIPDADREFLLRQKQTGAGYHKNIAYRPAEDKLTGFAAEDAGERQRLQAVMRRYSQDVERFLACFLAPYQQRWKKDYASFRPLEEEGRNLRLRARNDLLHTDAFPTRPTNGDRILRFFNNVNPAQGRKWMITEPFHVLARQFAGGPGIPLPKPAGNSALDRAWRRFTLRKRSPYDDFMMRFHNFLKENADFQANCPKYHFEFPPGSSWLAYTDTVSHAVLSGRYAVEQTFIISHQAMVAPQFAPVRVLEQMAGAPLTY